MKKEDFENFSDGCSLSIGFLSILSIIVFFIWFLINFISTDPSDYYYKKTVVKKNIVQVLKNGGGLDEIKHIYNTYHEDIGFKLYIPLNNFSPTDYYRVDYPLSGILNDILVDSLLKEKKDSVFYFSLKKMISENEKINPFDLLEKNQRDLFINVQQKSDTNYVKISTDIMKIAEELSKKNEAVNKYLNKSENGFYISLFALLLTFIFSVWQIYQNRKSSKQLNNIEKKINNKE